MVEMGVGGVRGHGSGDCEVKWKSLWVANGKRLVTCEAK